MNTTPAKTPPRICIVGPSGIDTEFEDSEEGIAGMAVEKVGFVKVGVGMSLCVVNVEVVSNVESLSPVVSVMIPDAEGWLKVTEAVVEAGKTRGNVTGS